MDSEARRLAILRALRQATEPVSASRLAKRMEVSRQAIVGDIALLRAQGSDITATARGYTMTTAQPSGRYIGKLACQHSLADTERELAAIVRLGGVVLDVVVDHYLYGEMTGQLNIATLRDVEDFVRRVRQNEARLLSELTDGAHLHTVACRDALVFAAISRELEAMGLLYPSK